MDRNEKLNLSADCEWCHCFKQGLFCRLYEYGLYWFSHAVKPLKPMPERVKGGDPVVYGGLPISSFEKLIAEGALHQVEATAYGWRWPYAQQKALPRGEKTPEFSAWREMALAAAPPVGVQAKAKAPGVKDILAEIAAFNLAAHTPMEAMNAIEGWQKSLRAAVSSA